MTTLARALELLGDPQGGYVLTALDLDGRVSTWGPAAERLTGYPADEVVGNSFSVLWSEPLSSDAFRRAAEQEVFADTAVLAPKRGSRLVADRRITLVNDAGHPPSFLAAISPALNQSRRTGSEPLPAAVLDTVVHPIFAAGLELNGLASILSDPALRQRALGTIDHLDEAIRNLRRIAIDIALDADLQ